MYPDFVGKRLAMNSTQLWRSHIGRVTARPSLHTTAARPRQFSVACQWRQNKKSTDTTPGEDGEVDREQVEEVKGAMARRLTQMTEDAMLEGGRSAQRNMEAAGFSEDLKRQLEERVKAAAFRSEYAAEHSILDLPASAGQGTREIAAAPAWTGTETAADSVLRMLDDASKPIRTPFKIPQPVNLKPAPKPIRSPGQRLEAAKEKTSNYTLAQAPGFSEEEREAMRREMRENLSPAAHSMPMSIQGLSSLANERIEDAIARGQFRQIQRGKGVNTETDNNANSAFIDTTEYFMNKIIQKQEIVPPWIEKQQELASEVSRFRQRIRVEWRRHAAMLIASQGGSLDEQMRRARGHAAAEARLVERRKAEIAFKKSDEQVSEINTDGRIVAQVEIPEAVESNGENKAPGDIPHLPPLRDEAWLGIERSYHELAVKHINKIARSYNLQAPRSAQKPYLNLDRELNNCFAEVAPQLAEEIRRRATERARPSAPLSGPSSSMFGSIGTANNVQVYEEDKAKTYGLKEMWRDMFSKDAHK